MFGKEAVKLITELDMHEDIRSFNVSITNIIIIISTVMGITFHFNSQEQVMRQVFEEMRTLYEANLVDRYIHYMAFMKVTLQC